MKEIKYKVVWVILFSCTLLLNSCKDSILAEDMEGSWVTSIVTSYDDGTKGHRNEQLTFKRDNSANNGGTFSERCIIDEELEEEEGNIQYKYVSSIEGIWEIKNENLSLHYDISTLEVKMRKKDIVFDQKYIKVDMFGTSSIFDEGYEQNQFIENLKKNIYKNLFRHYKESNEDTEDNELTFSDVQVQGSVLSFNTADMGRINYNHVKDDTSDIDVEEDKYKDESEYQHQRGGTIGEYEIAMFYDIDKTNNVNGFYCYASQGFEKRIFFTGKITNQDSKEHLALICDNQDKFDGYFDENRSYYTGMFSNKSNKQLEFVLYSIR